MVDRFYSDDSGVMERTDDPGLGEYVRYDDYRVIERERDELRAKVREYRDVLQEKVREYDERFASWDLDPD